jgi:hypothetical protein
MPPVNFINQFNFLQEYINIKDKLHTSAFERSLFSRKTFSMIRVNVNGDLSGGIRSVSVYTELNRTVSVSDRFRYSDL